MKSVFFKKLSISILFAGTCVFSSGFLSAETSHTVQKGETLYSISKKYSVTVSDISKANGIEGTDIKVGQKLVIPDSKTPSQQKAPGTETNVEKKTENYTVKKGDTWYAIARNLNINVKTLYELNGTDEKSVLKAGQTVKIPAGTTGATTAGDKTVSENASGKTETKKTQPAVSEQNSGANQSLPVPIVDTHSYSEKKGDPNLVWPVEKPEVTYLNGKVSGVTLSAKKDEPVYAIKSGTVMFCGSYRGFGNVVFIQSKTGHIYAYTGLGKILVSKGDYIDFKTQIGTAGIDSYSSRSQISLMVFQNGLPIDPAKAPRG